MAIKFLNTVQVDTDVLYVDAANNKVGIGITTPRTKLHVFNTVSSLPSLGDAGSAAQLGGNSFGTQFSTLTSGKGVIQQGRSDGTATSYDLLLQPSGGDIGIGTTTPSEKLEVNGTVIATATTDAYKGYIKQTITSSANEKAVSADYNLIPYNTLTTVDTDQPYNRMVAAYDGRIKKVYIRNTGGNTPSADTVNFKKQVNNTTAATVYSATVANASSAGMSAVYNFADSDFTFNEGDTFGILYQTVNNVGGGRAMGGVAINVIVEYNIT